MNQIEKMSAREAYAAYISGYVFVNVSENPTYKDKSLDVKRVLHIPYSQLKTREAELPVNHSVVPVSNVGNRSKHAAKWLLQQGFEYIAVLDGGLRAWEAEGFPMQLQA
jgi:rhodanese-related sulfurtransferase